LGKNLERENIMVRIVQKYGGTSVADTGRFLKAAKRIKKSHDQGNGIVVVVSAMGGVTDQLIKLANEVSDNPSDREMDMLLATGEQQSVALMAMTLNNLGCPAISLTGAQAGIETDGVHSKARIQNISPERIERYLEDGQVVIVAGFQGRATDEAITTLGRGGSDLTAVALAAALNTDLCQIYTDVDGVYTADPRIVPEARKIDIASHDEMLEMASLGAKVMQARSIEFAKKFGVQLEVRSSLKDLPGTLIMEETEDMEDVVVRGVSLDKNEAKVTVHNVADQPGQAARLFNILASASINVDMIIQSAGDKGKADISFTVPKNDLRIIRNEISERLIKEVGCEDIIYDENIAKVSLVGIGMRSHTGIAADMFSSLAKAGINIQMISTSEIKISCVLDEEKSEEAVRILHRTFKLDALPGQK